MAILHFNLLPAGFCKGSWLEDGVAKEHFSDILLESVNLLLNASLLRKRQDGKGDQDAEVVELQRLINYTKETQESKRVKMGGIFPLLIAQKSATL